MRANSFISGYGYINGGGVEAYDQSDATVRFNLFDGCSGGSVDISASHVLLENNVIARTRTADMDIGHGVEIHSATVQIRRNTFYHNNNESHGSALGHDIYYRGTAPAMERNLFVSPEDGYLINCGQFASTASSALDTVPDSFNWFWEVPPPPDWYGPWPPDPPFYVHLCWWGFVVDPLLCDPENNNFFLADGSPCPADTLPLGELNGGGLYGAVPIGCGPLDVLAVQVPPDMDVAAHPGELYQLVGFSITNTSDFPACANYRVLGNTETLVDQGNPRAFVGSTPILEPGETYVPPGVAIVLPNAASETPVDVDYVVAFAPVLAVSETLTTRITFTTPVAVGLQSFTGVETGGIVTLKWETADALSPDGWRVYRSNGGGPVLLTLAPLDAAARSYDDSSVELGRDYTYTLASVESDGEYILARVSVHTTAPELRLSQNTPNPFNPTTTIRFSLDRALHASLVVYTIEGKAIATLADEDMNAGPHAIPWDGSDDNGNRAASGVYLYRLRAGSRSLVRKMVLLK